jgi:hypothetical protein
MNRYTCKAVASKYFWISPAAWKCILEQAAYEKELALGADAK